MLACDGANSFVRQKLNIKSFNYECDQDWIVVDYEIDPKYEILAGPMHICDYKRPTTLAHISDNILDGNLNSTKMTMLIK